MFDLLNLQLFAESGEGADPAATEGAETGDPSTGAEEDRKAKYGQFKADYKAEFDAEVQSIIKDRIKREKAENSKLRKQISDINPVMEYLGKKYNVNPSDVDSILKAFDNDDSILQQEAFERDMTVDQLKLFKQIERENAKLRASQEESRKMAQFAKWDKEAEELKNTYPNVDINELLSDEDTLKLMDSGIPLKKAYEIAHFDELMSGAMNYAVNQASQKISNAVAANSKRPDEAGLGNNTASVSATPDFKNMSLEQMEAINSRIMAGERIDFRHLSF